MAAGRVAEARRWFAEELRHTAQVTAPGVVEAFATVPREHFAGPGPWRILSPLRSGEYWTTDDDSPEHLYHDVRVAIDEARRLNNGQPALWASLYDQLRLGRGDHVVHVGARTGYYSAIVAEIVGVAGRVTAVEVDPGLAARARDNLALAWPQATVVATDGFALRPERAADAIVVNADVSHLSPAWLDALAPKGRLLVPVTTSDRSGTFLLVRRPAREGWRCPARFVSGTGIISCVGARDDAAEERLKAALRGSYFTAIQSLRRAPEEPDETCWLAGEGWWLSTAPVPADDNDAGKAPPA